MTRTSAHGTRLRTSIVLVSAYACLLALSTITRATAVEPGIPAEARSVTLPAVEGERRLSQTVRLAYREFGSASNAGTLPVIVLHGSPGSGADLMALGEAIGGSFHVIVPDLPGFGASSRDVPDYSFRAHARYVLDLMNVMRIGKAHVVAFSMGGGVGLSLADAAPERVASLTMLSAIGVQEMELLGEYHVNHALHGVQFAGLWAAREFLPHFGWLDGSMLGVSYARNFYDSDQRPLREILGRLELPVLVLHGATDPLVPVEAAREHARIVPQAELRILDADHFMVFIEPALPADIVVGFLDRVGKGEALERSHATPDRLALAAAPFDPANQPTAKGVAAIVLGLLIASSTLVSEDLTCIAAGVMAAQGRIGFALASVACLSGIFVGDLMLFLAGRWLGRPAVKRAPLRWFLSGADVERCSVWFNKRGVWAIVLSRFVPGTRLPTYFAAGVLDTSLLKFSLVFLAAAAVWTPMLVAMAMILGGEVLESFLAAGHRAVVALGAAVAVAYLLVRFALSMVTHRGRRLVVGRLKRLARWEFWPPWVFYPPVVFYIAWLAVRHRGLTVFTLANPAIPHGGFVGESKWRILSAFPADTGLIAKSAFIDGGLTVSDKEHAVDAFTRTHNLDYPIVLKPDVGERGSGVTIARCRAEASACLAATHHDLVVQEYVGGAEFGVFYIRRPTDARGRIFAMTDKRFPEVVGDGSRTLERLILDDPRAVCMANAYFANLRERIWDVPAAGERVRLVELGTHCRGAVFLDGAWAKTAELERAIDRLSLGFEGFHFGRYDIRTPDLAEFQRGAGFKVVELNGVTSEATNIYDPKNSVLDAWRVIFEQWRIAFEIGAANRAAGRQPSTLLSLVKEVALFFRGDRGQPAPPEPSALESSEDTAVAH